MTKNFSLLNETVISQGLCTRCGICAGVCPNGSINIGPQNFPVLAGQCACCGLCNDCCPGGEADLPSLAQALSGQPHDGSSLLGHVENSYVAHAADSVVRWVGASGGMITALLLFLLTAGQIDGAILVDFDPKRPHVAKGILATTPEEIRSAASSKYTAVPSMAVMQELRKREGKFVVVARPCQVHGLRKLAQADPRLSAKIEAIFGLYCSCCMGPDGPVEAMRAVGIREEDVARFEFRGGKWPGAMTVQKKDGSTVSLHPAEAYGTVINGMFRLFGAERCRMCVDGLSELADLSFGDFWAFDYSEEFKGMERCTLVTQRTGKGLRILELAERGGAVVLRRLPADRFSKRALAMVKGKRSRAAIEMARRIHKGLAVPFYHISMPKPSLADWKKNFSSVFAGLFHGEKGRALALRILLSPLASTIHQFRMKFFVRQRKN